MASFSFGIAGLCHVSGFSFSFFVCVNMQLESLQTIAIESSNISFVESKAVIPYMNCGYSFQKLHAEV